MTRLPDLVGSNGDWHWTVSEGLAMATAELAFPTASTRPEEQDEASEDDIPIRDLVNRRRNQPDPAAKSNCPGCRRHMASGRREHTRVPG